MAQPRTFTKVIGGQTVTQFAYSPADTVRLRFDGWAEQPAAATPEATEPAEDPAEPAGPVRPPFAAPADKTPTRKATEKNKTAEPDTSAGAAAD